MHSKLICHAFFGLMFFLTSNISFAFEKDPLSEKLPVIQPPPGAKVILYADRLAVDGMPISMQQFIVPGRIDDVRLFFLRQFRSLGTGVEKETFLGVEAVVGYQINELYYSVQMHQEGPNVVGKMTVTPLPDSRMRSSRTELPLPPGSELVNKVEALDGAQRSETLTIKSNQSVETFINYMKNELQRQGWTLTAAKVHNAKSSLVTFQRGAGLIQITASRSNMREVYGFTQVVITWVKN